MRLAPAFGFSAFFLASCSIFSPAGPSPYVQAATQPVAIPLTPVTLQPHVGPLPAKNVGAKGAMATYWTFAGAPSDGFDALKIAMTPTIVDNAPQNFIYWAYQGWFVDNSVYYVGLQPNGQYGKTALFSVFGDGTAGGTASCAAGADNGAGTSCHIPYNWTLGNSYQFIVRLIGGDTKTFVWDGAVADLTTNQVTEIGTVSVPASRGLLKATGSSFSEVFHTVVACPQQPRAEVLLQGLVGYRSGRPVPGTVASFDASSQCNPSFFGDGKTYVYQAGGY